MIALVFSKDRALQCDALLRSFAHQCLVPPTIVVLYTCSNEAHENSYHVLSKNCPRYVTFVPERDFRADVLRLLEEREQVLFLVDDTIFVRPVRLETISRLLSDFPTALGVSLRLGRNTTYCYAGDKPQIMPAIVNVGDDYVGFNWSGAEGDFGYPLEVSSSVYRVADLRLDALPFDGPNALEGLLSEQAHRYRESHPILLCPKTSVAFSAPLNRVQDVCSNRVGTRYSADELLRGYEAGRRIDVTALDGFTPQGAHEEIELRFVDA